jgi:hypothetical protein
MSTNTLALAAATLSDLALHSKHPALAEAALAVRAALASAPAPAAQPEPQWFPHFSIVATIARFALRQADAGVLEAASHQVERLMDVVRDHYHPTQHKMLADLWLQSRKEIKEGRRPMQRLVPSEAAPTAQPVQALRVPPLTESQISEMATQEQLLLLCDDLEDLIQIVRAVESAQRLAARPTQPD